MIPIGHQIYLRRLEQKLTQEELAHQAGIPQPNLSNIEKGKQDITVSTLRKIADALSIEPGEFFNAAPDEKRKGRLRNRSVLEGIARMIAGGGKMPKARERETVELFKQVIPGKHRVRVRELHRAWLELRKRFSPEEINAVHERTEEYKRRLL